MVATHYALFIKGRCICLSLRAKPVPLVLGEKTLAIKISKFIGSTFLSFIESVIFSLGYLLIDSQTLQICHNILKNWSICQFNLLIYWPLKMPFCMASPDFQHLSRTHYFISYCLYLSWFRSYISGLVARFSICGHVMLDGLRGRVSIHLDLEPSFLWRHE